MKKTLINLVAVLLISINLAFAETCYQMSERDYNNLIIEKCSLQSDIDTMNMSKETRYLKQAKICWINEIICNLKKYDKEMSVDDKLSIIRGEISLQKMEFLKLIVDLKSRGIKLKGDYGK